jgi:hypothetical protein
VQSVVALTVRCAKENYYGCWWKGKKRARSAEERIRRVLICLQCLIVLITNRRKATALERTSPKADRALSDLEEKQKGLAMRNMLRDELG